MKFIKTIMEHIRAYCFQKKAVFWLLIFTAAFNAVSVSYCYGNLLWTNANRTVQDVQHREYVIAFEERSPTAEAVKTFSANNLLAGCVISQGDGVYGCDGRYPMTVISGTAEFTNGYEMLVDPTYGLSVGDTVPYRGVDFKVIGVVTSAYGERYISMDNFYQLCGTEQIGRIHAVAAVHEEYDNDRVLRLIEKLLPEATAVGGGALTNDLIEADQQNTVSPLIWGAALLGVLTQGVFLWVLLSWRLPKAADDIKDGAAKADVVQLAFWEMLILQIGGSGIGLLLHRVVFMTFFSSWNVGAGLSYGVGDYMFIWLMLIALSLPVILVLLFIYYRRLTKHLRGDAVQAKPRGVATYLLLSLLVTAALMGSLMAAGRVKNIKTAVNALEGAKTADIYVLNSFASPTTLLGKDQELVGKPAEDLRADPAVKDVFTVRRVSPVLFNGESVNLVLYDPNMLEALPGLKSLGLWPGKDVGGCVLSGEMFHGLEAGDSITLSFSAQLSDPVATDFPVAGQLNEEQMRLGLSVSATTFYAEDLFVQGDCILLVATDEVMEKIEKVARHIEYDRNMLVLFEDTVPVQEREQLLREHAPNHMAVSLKESLRRSEERICKTLKQELPIPVLLTVLALLACLGVLCARQEHKEKKRNRTRVFKWVAILLPILLCAVLLLLWHSVQWKPYEAFLEDRGVSLKDISENREFYGRLAMAYNYVMQCDVDISIFLTVVLIFYGLPGLGLVGLGLGRKYRNRSISRDSSE